MNSIKLRLPTIPAFVTLMLGVYFLVGISPSFAKAQEPASSFDKLPVKAGDKISVVPNNGSSSEGTILDFSATSLTLRIGGTTRNVLSADVLEIRQRRSDPLWNGLILGAGVGFGIGIIGLFVVDGSNQARKTGFGLMIAGGAGLGLVLDARHKDEVVIYRAPNRGPSANEIRLTPLVSGKAKGVMLSVSF